MKNFFALLFLVLFFSQCQPGPDRKNEESTGTAQALIIVPAIQEKLYNRPSVKGLGIALVQPQETLQVLDTTDFFFYKIKVLRAGKIKEGYILKAAFTDKPHLIAAESLIHK